MDDRRFDALIRALGSGTSRRTVLRGLLGVGAATAAVAGDRAQAARRGFAGPKLPTPSPTATPPPCAQIGDACGVGCCSGNCCGGTCIDDSACCIDTDCGISDECTTITCSADHACQISIDASCGLDCSSCAFSDFCDCLPLCMTGPPSENIACIQSLCAPYLADCPEACAGANPCVSGV